jgi:hypothetical protein
MKKRNSNTIAAQLRIGLVLLFIAIIAGLMSSCTEDADTWYQDSDPATNRFLFDKYATGKTVADIHFDPSAKVDFTIEKGYTIQRIAVKYGNASVMTDFTGTIKGVNYPNIEQIQLTSSDGKLLITFDNIVGNTAQKVTIQNASQVNEYPNGILTGQYYANKEILH